MLNIVKTIFKVLGKVIETHKGIRRFMVLTGYPLWLYLTYKTFMKQLNVSPSIYASFTSVIGVITGFYFAGRSNEDRRNGGE